MKKLTMICMSTLLLLALSCKKDNEQKPAYEGEGFYATIEPREDGSKTHLNGTAVCWDLSDAFYVYSQTYTSQPACFTLHSIEQNGTTGHFTCDGVSDNFFSPPYTAYYPSDLSAGLTLNNAQNAVYNNGFQKTFASGANPMAAYSTGKYLSFKNVCGLLELKLHSTKANCNIASITIKSKTDENLWGSGAIHFQGDTPILGTLSGGGNTLTLNCGNHPMSTNSGSPSYFYFVLPANTLAGGFDITVTDANGGVYTNSATGNYSIQRSRIRQTPNMAVTTRIPVPDGAIEGGGKFSVGNGKQVYFSKGNLTYNVGESKWKFYENQYECDPNQLNSSVISLFTWGYGTWSTNPNTGVGHYPHQQESFSDWGSQPIANGGNQGGLWRTLNASQWAYLFFGRRVNGCTSNGNARGTLYTFATVEGHRGAVIFPDNYSTPTSAILSYIPEGCLFLPTTGYWIDWAGLCYYGTYAQYWTASETYYNGWLGCCATVIYRDDDQAVAAGEQAYDANYRFAVRLVQDVP